MLVLQLLQCYRIIIFTDIISLHYTVYSCETQHLISFFISYDNTIYDTNMAKKP